VYSSPALGINGTIYVVANAVNSGGLLYAISSAGLHKWSLNLGWTKSSLTVGTDGTIYVGSCNSLLAVSPGGTVRWSFYTGSCLASPVVGPNGSIYAVSADGNFRAFTSTFGLQWTYVTGSEIIAPPAVGSDGSIYIKSGDAKVYALSSDGNLKWTYTTDSFWGRTVVGSDGRIYVESLSSLYVLSPDGQLIWRFPHGGHVTVSGTTAYLCSSDDGNLYALSEIPGNHGRRGPSVLRR